MIERKQYLVSENVELKGVTIHVLAVSQGPLEQTPPSVLAALAHGFEQRNVECSKPTHKIRVDFKVGHIFKFIFSITLTHYVQSSVVAWFQYHSANHFQI